MGAFLLDTNLREANLRDMDLRDVDFSGANLWGTDLQGVNLRGANLSGVFLRGADFRWAGLEGANLSGANFWDATGNGKEIKSLQCGRYYVAYTATYLQIGCEGHPIGDWWEFSDEEIDRMDPERSLEWWREWKPRLQELIEKVPAVPTGTEEAE
jgi:hypothetical protein